MTRRSEKEKLNMLQAEAEADVAYHEAGHYAVTHLLIANASANFMITGLQMETSEGHIRGQAGTEFPGTLNKNQLISILLAGITAQAYHQYIRIPVASRGDVLSDVKEIAQSLSSAAGRSDLRKIAWIHRHFPEASFEPEGMIMEILKESPPFNEGYPDLPSDFWDQHLPGTVAAIHQHWPNLSRVAELLATKLTLDPEAALAAWNA